MPAGKYMPERWRKEYGSLKTDQMRRMKELEKENVRLRRAISELTPDKLILQDAGVTDPFGEWIIVRMPREISEPCTAPARHRSGPGGAGCIRAAYVPLARAASVDESQGDVRGR